MSKPKTKKIKWLCISGAHDRDHVYIMDWDFAYCKITNSGTASIPLSIKHLKSEWFKKEYLRNWNNKEIEDYYAIWIEIISDYKKKKRNKHEN